MAPVRDIDELDHAIRATADRKATAEMNQDIGASGEGFLSRDDFFEDLLRIIDADTVVVTEGHSV